MVNHPETSNSEKTKLLIGMRSKERQQHFPRTPVKAGGMEEGRLEGMTD